MVGQSKGHKDTRVRAIVSLPAGEPRTWMIIQLLDGKGTWTIKDVATFCGDRERTVHNYVVRLEKAGFVKRGGRATAEPGHQGHAPHLFEIVQQSIEAPRIRQDGTMLPEMQNQRLWRTMRMLKEFTVPELAGYAEDGEQPLNVGSVRVYCAYSEERRDPRRQGPGLPSRPKASSARPRPWPPCAKSPHSQRRLRPECQSHRWHSRKRGRRSDEGLSATTHRLQGPSDRQLGRAAGLGAGARR